MKILITGSTGFVGSKLTKELAKFHKVYETSRTKGYQFNITDVNRLTQICVENDIECIIHTAGCSIVKHCEQFPFNAFEANTLGTLSVLEAARNSEVRKVIVYETDKVYGDNGNSVNEESDLIYDSPYGFSKVMSAKCADFYRTRYDMNIISVRSANIFGPGDHSSTRLVPNIMRAIKNKTPIRLYNDSANMVRDFIYINDVVDMTKILVEENPKDSIYNFSTNSKIKIKSFIEKCLNELNSKCDLIIENKGFEEIPYQEIDGSRFVNEFNFKFTAFEESIYQTYQWYKTEL